MHLTLAFFSATVVQGSGGATLLPLEIVECHSDAITIRNFFQQCLVPKILLPDSAQSELDEVIMNNEINLPPACSLDFLSDEKLT